MKKLLLIIAALVINVPVYAADAETKTAEPGQSVSINTGANNAVEEPDTIILSDTLHYDDVAKVSTFTGNVILTRGALTLRAEKLVMREDADGNQFGTATTNPGEIVTIYQENPEKFETIIGTGNQADYDGGNGTVTLTGQAVVTRKVCGEPFDNVRGSKIVYHEKTAKYEAFGGANSAGAGGRVRSLTQPQSKVDKAIAKCKSQ